MTRIRNFTTKLQTRLDKVERNPNLSFIVERHDDGNDLIIAELKLAPQRFARETVWVSAGDTGLLFDPRPILWTLAQKAKKSSTYESYTYDARADAQTLQIELERISA